MDKEDRQAGMTLVELLLVVSLLSILAVGALMSVEPVRKTSFDAAIRQTVQTLEFARREAQRIGAPVVASIDTAAKTLEVYRMDFSTVPASRIALMHPLEKRPYRVALGTAPFSGGGISIQAVFTFADGTSGSEIGFNRTGKPGKILSATTLSPLQSPDLWRGAWQSDGMAYNKDDWVVYKGVDYNAVQGHSSGVSFESDVQSGRWAVRSRPAQIALFSAGHSHNIDVLPVTGFIHSRP